MNIDKKPQKIYRLGLYGLSGSGKTCMLAALAMPHYPHPSGHTCVWRAMDVPPSTDDELEQQDEYLMHLHHSKEWIETAVYKLSQRDVPESNPTGEEPFQFEYDFTASTHQTFRIELVDYAGEFINPTTSISKSTCAKHLWQKFLDIDGLLVLVEAPFYDGDPEIDQYKKRCNEQIYADLYQLRQAFNSFRCEIQQCGVLDIPVVLLITKWDRYSNIDYTNPASEQTKLENFLNSQPPPPHKALHDVLHFSVTEGNFKIFPISALGSTDCVLLDEGNFVEQPKQVAPLNAFGLEDAFIWLAQRCDAIDFQKFKEQATTGFFRQCQKVGLSLLNRFPRNSEQVKQINTILQECQKAKRVRILYLFIAMIALWFVIETSLDAHYYRKHLVAAKNPHATTSEQLEQAETWFTQYIRAPYFRHFLFKIFLNRTKAQTILTDMRTEREKFLWEPVEQAEKTNLQKANEQASIYLKSYPYGEHAKDALNIKLRAEIIQQQWENDDAFHTIDILLREINTISEKKDKIVQLTQLIERLRYLPKHPQVDTEEMRQKRLKKEEELLKQLKQLENQYQWEIFRAEFARNIQAGKFLVATQRLLNSHPPATNLNEKEILKKDIIQELEQRLAQAIKNNSLNVADKLLKEYAKFPDELQSPENNKKIHKYEWEIFQKDFEKMQARKLLKAAQLLFNRKPPTTYLNEHALLKREIISQLEQQMALAFKEDRLEDANDLLKEYAKFPDELQTTVNNKKIDKVLYNALYYAVNNNSKNVERYIKMYLNNAKGPLKLDTMKQEVSKYGKYLKNTEPSHKIEKLQLKLAKIDWKYANDDDSKVIVEFNIRRKTIITEYKVNANSNTPMEPNKIGYFEATPSDSITITIKVIRNSMFFGLFGEYVYSEGKAEKPVSELAEEDNPNLRLHKGEGWKGKEIGKAYLEMAGYPKKPRLPLFDK